MRNFQRLVAATIILATLSLMPLSALADDDEARTAARALADRGYELYQAGKYQEAIEHFRRAEDQFHAVTLVLVMAEAHEKIGKLADAHALYQQVVSEQLANYAPAEFRDAQKTARAALAALEPRVPRVRVRAKGAPVEKLQLVLDGKQLSARGANEALPVNPGEHTLVATTPEGRSESRNFSAREGEVVDVEFAVALPVQQPAAREGAAPEPDGQRDGSLVPAIIAFSVGAAGLAVGGITGALALGKAGDLEERCPTKSCPPEDEELADSARSFATVSTVSFVVGGIGVGAGIALLLLRPGGGSASGGSATAVQARVGPGSILLTGRF